MTSSRVLDLRTPVIGFALVACLGLAATAHSATSCFNESCAASCSPGPPVGISTIVAPGDFPTGADTPVAFVDPDDGGDKKLIATQEGGILVWDGNTGDILPTFFLDLRSSSGGPV
jgi:hypothetical protein